MAGKPFEYIPRTADIFTREAITPSGRDILNNNFLFLFSFLFLIFLLFGINGCTVNNGSLRSGVIPAMEEPSPEAVEHGSNLYEKISRKFVCNVESRQYRRLNEIFNQLTIAANVDRIPWRISLLEDPDIFDIRAVTGNYIFVWSGIMNAVESDDEFAGLLAHEMSHAIAQHTRPVRYTMAAEMFFMTAELATTIGLMVASQGTLAVSGNGWMKWAYTEIADLDPMDREYNEHDEREAAGIALLTLSRTQYSPHALLDFWKRVAVDEALARKYKRFSRDMSPQERVAMLEELMTELPAEGSNLAENL